MNPRGSVKLDDIENSNWRYESDPVSIFRIVVLNREVDAATAQNARCLPEIIIAPSYTDEALGILTTKKKNLRILELPFDASRC